MTQRYAEIDYLKAIGILAVILIHCLRPEWSPHASSAEAFLNQELRFAVPGFLFCSGFLYAHTRAFDWSVTFARLRRILVPYLVASISAEIYYASRGLPRTPLRIFGDLLFGNAFGHYYYVFIIVTLVLVTPALARLGARSIIALTALIMLSQAYLIASESWSDPNAAQLLSRFWVFRLPILWWNFFLLGWIARHRYAELSRWTARHRSQIAALLVILCAGFSAAQGIAAPLLVARFSAWLQIYALIMLIATLSCGAQSIPAPVRRVSDATYAIYLFHLFFLRSVQPYFPHSRGVLEPTVVAAQTLAAIVGSFALIALGRLLLGRRSRLILGA